MSHDPFDVFSAGLTISGRLWRIAFLAAVVAVILLDLFIWRP